MPRLLLRQADILAKLHAFSSQYVVIISTRRQIETFKSTCGQRKIVKMWKKTFIVVYNWPFMHDFTTHSYETYSNLHTQARMWDPIKQNQFVKSVYNDVVLVELNSLLDQLK